MHALRQDALHYKDNALMYSKYVAEQNYLDVFLSRSLVSFWDSVWHAT